MVGAARRPAAAAAAPGRSAHSRPMQSSLLRLADGLARRSMPQPTTCKRTGIEHDKSKLGWKSAPGALARASLIGLDHVHDDWSHCGVLRASECSSPRICRERLSATRFFPASPPQRSRLRKFQSVSCTCPEALRAGKERFWRADERLRSRCWNSVLGHRNLRCVRAVQLPKMQHVSYNDFSIIFFCGTFVLTFVNT